MATPWKPPPPPMPGSNDHLQHRPVAAAGLERLRAAFDAAARDPGRVVVLGEGITRTVRARRVWRPLEDTAARFAAPWLELVWVVTAGRMGAPMYRWEIPDAFPKPAWVDHRDGPLPETYRPPPPPAPPAWTDTGRDMRR